MSFSVKNAVKKDISGSYRLLSQTVGRTQNTPIHDTPTQPPLQPTQPLPQPQPAAATSDQPPFEDQAPEAALMMAEADSYGDWAAAGSKRQAQAQAGQNPNQNQNQNQNNVGPDDDLLFLRYLELDPIEGPDAAQVAVQRKASGNRTGRTPFTTTKKLTRSNEDPGFGFSILWTRPPRVERVETGRAADRAGLRSGDRVIFVDKHNVVASPESKVLELIRAQGSELTLEVFRRGQTATCQNGTANPVAANQQPPPSILRDEVRCRKETIVNANLPPHPQPARSSTACSATTAASVDYNRRSRLHLPQVTFSKETDPLCPDEARRRALLQLVNCEQHYATAMRFGVGRYATPLSERRDLMTPTEHKALFQNCEELLLLSDDLLDELAAEEGEPRCTCVARAYLARLSRITQNYRRYCGGLKRADCVLAAKTKDCNSEFMRFLNDPQIPRRRPDLTTFIHKPLEHHRDVLRLLQMVLKNIKPSTAPEEYAAFSRIVHELQVTYRDITSGAGLMEPLGEGKPLLSMQDLESRLVFTKCKPFVLSAPGRQWIFGGDLTRVEGRTVRPHWALLFTDLLLFAKVSRDRVLFITEEPIKLSDVSDTCFNIRKRNTEFRLTLDPLGLEGAAAQSPTAHCGPDLTRTPRRSRRARTRTLILRAPTLELKAVWQNLLQRQIFQAHANVTGGTAQSSPLESPDAHPVNAHPMTQSVATLHSITDSSYHAGIQVRQQQQQQQHPTMITTNDNNHTIDTNNHHTTRRQISLQSNNSIGDGKRFCTPPPNAMTPDTPSPNISSAPVTPTHGTEGARKSFTYFKNATLPRPSTRASNASGSGANNAQDMVDMFGDESWDLLELDMDFNEVNLDTSFTCDLEEKIYFRDDYRVLLPDKPTPPNSLDL